MTVDPPAPPSGGADARGRAPIVAPRTTQGVLELLPAQQLAFQRMLDTIRRGFERFGFLPIETPVFELTDVLLTKSGGETEKQVYFVQSTGSIEQGAKPDLALRFDLTVPLARYVAEHEHALNFPFRRYQIQRVYRGERAQKGRYREFYQCDIDAIGKDTLSIAYDVEMPAVIYGIFTKLEIGKFTIYINNRKLMRGLLDAIGFAEAEHEAVFHEVDRLGKMERAEIEKRIVDQGIAAAKVTRLFDLLAAEASSADTLATLDAFPTDSGLFREGAAELRRVYEGTLALGVPAEALKIKLSILRGLDYYTGTVYETFLDEQPKLGSICSGGRYENLAGLYTKSKLPGVGISIGATRLFSKLLEACEVIEKQIADAEKAKADTAALRAQLAAAERKLHGGKPPAIADAIVLNLDSALAGDCAAIATELRTAGFNIEVFGGDQKVDKQMKYADKARIPLVLRYGASERDRGIVNIKDMRSGDQHDVPRADLATWIRARL